MNGYFAPLHVKPFPLAFFVFMHSLDSFTEVEKLQPNELYMNVMPSEWQDWFFNYLLIVSETYARWLVVLSWFPDNWDLRFLLYDLVLCCSATCSYTCLYHYGSPGESLALHEKGAPISSIFVSVPKLNYLTNFLFCMINILLVFNKKGEKKWTFIEILPCDNCYHMNHLFIQQIVYAQSTETNGGTQTMLCLKEAHNLHIISQKKEQNK